MRLLIIMMLLLSTGMAYAQSPMGNVSRTLTENAARTTSDTAGRNAAQGAQGAAAAAVAETKSVTKDEAPNPQTAPAAPQATPGGGK